MAFDFEARPYQENKSPIKKILVGILIVSIVIGITFLARNMVFGTGAASISAVPKSTASPLPSLVVPLANTTTSQQSVVIFGANNLLGLVLDLREAYIKKKTVDTATLVTQIDSEIKKLQNNALSQAWETLALCLAGVCGDQDFAEFVRMISSDKYTSHAQLILDYLTADKYWNTENTIRFSEAITSVNKQVQQLNKTSLSSAWKKTIDCAGNCSSKSALMFGFLEELR